MSRSVRRYDAIPADMLNQIISGGALFILHAIRYFGYGGIAGLMALESACVPIPSEVIMTFSGYLSALHELTFTGVIIAGTIGSLGGSLIAYLVGFYGGRPFLEHYGTYIFISVRDLDRADRWFQRHGEATVCVGRLIPVIRTFISLPAGIAHMRLGPFIVYSLVGSAIWCAALVWVGEHLGRHWNRLDPYMHWVNLVIGFVGLTLILSYIIRHIRARTVR